MATIITKNSSTASSVPLNTQLVQGELAVNVTDKRLYTQDATDTVVELGTNPSSLTLPNGTANAVPYLNGSKVLTSGSALTFDGTTLNTSAGTPIIKATASTTNALYGLEFNGGALDAFVKAQPNNSELRIASGRSAGWGGFTSFYIDTSEQMRLTSTGLGIGTSSPGAKLDLGTSVDASKLLVYGSGNVKYGFGIQTDTLRYFVPTGSAVHSFGALSSADGTTYTELMRLDASGNLGLGVTPSAWGYINKALQVGNSVGLVDSTGGASFLTNNWYLNTSGQYTYSATRGASYYQQYAGAHSWYTAPSGTAGAAITFTQAMTLDASGRLGVGTTSPQNTFVVSNGGAEGLEVVPNSSGSPALIAYNRNTASYIRLTLNGSEQVFQTSGTERARIDSSGNLLAGVTSGTRHWLSKNNAADYAATINNSNANPIGAQIYHNTDSNGAGNQFLDCQGAGNVRAQIRSNGGLANYSANNVNLSDARLKRDFTPSQQWLEKLCKIEVGTFFYKDQTDDIPNLGVLAQQVEIVAPELVDPSGFGTAPEGEEPYKAIYQTDLQYALLKAIQELKAEFDAYKAAHP